MQYSFKREQVTTNYLRPRFTPSDAERDEGIRAMKANIAVDGPNKGHLCWGIVDENDNLIAPNQQFSFHPDTGDSLPLSVEELKEDIDEQRVARGARPIFA